MRHSPPLPCEGSGLFSLLADVPGDLLLFKEGAAWEEKSPVCRAVTSVHLCLHLKSRPVMRHKAFFVYFLRQLREKGERFFVSTEFSEDESVFMKGAGTMRQVGE